MSRFSVPCWRSGALALAGVALFSAAALAQGAGAGFETAPGSQPVITSNGMPVVNTAPAAPASGVAAQQDYSAFGDSAPPGMYVTPMGYGAATAQAAPAYGAQNSGAPLTPTPGYSIQAAPTSGPYAAAPQPSMYPAQPYLPPPPQAYGAPTPDYTLQGNGSPYAQPYNPYGPQPYAAQPQPMPQQEPVYAAQPAQASPYTAAQRMVQGLPPGPQPYPQPAPYAQPAPQQYAQPAPQPQPMQPAPNQNPMMARPYSNGATAYGAPLPSSIGAPQQAGAAPAEGGYTLGPGDKVRVTIYGEADLSGEYQLDGNGNIRLPLIGLMRAVGYTAGGLEAWVRSALVPNYLRNPRINVEIVSYRPIYVVGAVQKPGQYGYINNMTLLNAVALAGGFTSQSKQSVVYVRPEGESAERTVDTRAPLLIRPGDTVRVDTTVFWDAMNLFAPLSSPIGLAAAVR